MLFLLREGSFGVLISAATSGRRRKVAYEQVQTVTAEIRSVIA